MTDRKIGLGSPSRRDVLRKGMATAFGLSVGTAAVSTPVTATYCPRSPGYWMNNDWPDAVPNQREVTLENVNKHVPGLSFDTIEEWKAFLRRPKRGDKGLIMAFHLVATIVNFQGVPDRDCWDTGVEDVDGDLQLETVQDVKRLAQKWLKASDFPDEQRSWIVPGAPVEDGEPLKDILDAFNNNALDINGCPCHDSDDEDEDEHDDGDERDKDEHDDEDERGKDEHDDEDKDEHDDKSNEAEADRAEPPFQVGARDIATAPDAWQYR